MRKKEEKKADNSGLIFILMIVVAMSFLTNLSKEVEPVRSDPSVLAKSEGEAEPSLRVSAKLEAIEQVTKTYERVEYLPYAGVMKKRYKVTEARGEISFVDQGQEIRAYVDYKCDINSAEEINKCSRDSVDLVYRPGEIAKLKERCSIDSTKCGKNIKDIHRDSSLINFEISLVDK